MSRPAIAAAYEEDADYDGMFGARWFDEHTSTFDYPALCCGANAKPHGITLARYHRTVCGIELDSSAGRASPTTKHRRIDIVHRGLDDPGRETIQARVDFDPGRGRTGYGSSPRPHRNSS